MPDKKIQNNKLTILLPCFNPIKNWEKTVVENIELIQKKISGSVNLIIVNDGSTQNVTEADIKFIKTNLNSVEIISYAINKGKGAALRSGVKKITNFPIVYTDIDFPYTLKSFEAIYKKLTEGHDVVLGKRNSDYYKNTPFIRKIISKTLRWTLKIFLKLPTDDTQCGIKGFNKKGADLFLTTEINRFLFDLEFVKLISKRQLNCTTVDVSLKPNIVFSKVNFKILFKESINFIKVLFRKWILFNPMIIVN